MINEDLLVLYNSIDIIQKSNVTGVKFAYTLEKNFRIIKPEVEAIALSIKESKEFKEYNQQREELAKQFSKKDEKGEPIVVGSNYVIENKKEFDEAFEKLQRLHQATVDARVEQINDYEKLMKEENATIEDKLFKMSLDEVPKEITAGQLKGIYILIKE